MYIALLVSTGKVCCANQLRTAILTGHESAVFPALVAWFENFAVNSDHEIFHTEDLIHLKP